MTFIIYCICFLFALKGNLSCCNIYNWSYPCSSMWNELCILEGQSAGVCVRHWMRGVTSPVLPTITVSANDIVVTLSLPPLGLCRCSTSINSISFPFYVLPGVARTTSTVQGNPDLFMARVSMETILLLYLSPSVENRILALPPFRSPSSSQESIA